MRIHGGECVPGGECYRDEADGQGKHNRLTELLVLESMAEEGG